MSSSSSAAISSARSSSSASSSAASSSAASSSAASSSAASSSAASFSAASPPEARAPQTPVGFRSPSPAAALHTGGLESPSPAARALPFLHHTSLEHDLGDFVPSGRQGPVVRVYASVTLASDDAVAKQFRSYLDVKLSSSSLPTKIYNNSHIVSFLSSKIANASKEPDAEDDKTGATLSCVSLSDRYLPALKRLQLREAGVADEIGWEEVKVAVMTRASAAGLPLVSKGLFRSSLFNFVATFTCRLTQTIISLYSFIISPHSIFSRFSHFLSIFYTIPILW